MDMRTRKAAERRSLELWREAGRPDGSGLGFWLQAESELGVIPKVEPDDPLVTLHELAVEARRRDRVGAAAAP